MPPITVGSVLRSPIDSLSANAGAELAACVHLAQFIWIEGHDVRDSPDNHSDWSFKTDYRVRLVGCLELSHLIGPQLKRQGRSGIVKVRRLGRADDRRGDVPGSGVSPTTV
jgi:hypothetical protein